MKRYNKYLKTSIMMPLKFSETLRYKGILDGDYSLQRNVVRKALIEAVESGDVLKFRKAIENFAKQVFAENEDPKVFPVTIKVTIEN
jgi:hypothetical protein